MATILDLNSHLEPFIEVPGATSVAEGRILFQEAQERFMIITEKGNPQALVVEEHLAKSIDGQAVSLVSMVKQLPPLVVVERASTALDVEDLKILFLWLSRTKAPGLVVYQNDAVIGAVSRRTIVRALPLSAIPPSSRKGNVVVPECSYLCRKCAEQDPPAALVLSERGKVPKCPKHRFEHSTNFMEKESVYCVQHRS